MISTIIIEKFNIVLFTILVCFAISLLVNAETDLLISFEIKLTLGTNQTISKNKND